MHAKATPLVDSIVLLEQVAVAPLRGLLKKACAADAGNRIKGDFLCGFVR